MGMNKSMVLSSAGGSNQGSKVQIGGVKSNTDKFLISFDLGSVENQKQDELVGQTFNPNTTQAMNYFAFDQMSDKRSKNSSSLLLRDSLSMEKFLKSRELSNPKLMSAFYSWKASLGLKREKMLFLMK